MARMLRDGINFLVATLYDTINGVANGGNSGGRESDGWTDRFRNGRLDRFRAKDFSGRSAMTSRPATFSTQYGIYSAHFS